MHYKFGMCLECVGEETTRIRGRNNTPPWCSHESAARGARIIEKKYGADTVTPFDINFQEI